MAEEPKRQPTASEREPLPWTFLGGELHARCAVFDVMKRRYRHPERETEGDFYVLQSRDWVNVLPLTPAKEVVLVRQWRFGVEAASWEIPGGVMDENEEPIAAGLRELREETGYEAKSARLLGKARPNPAIQMNTCHFVLAENVAPTGGLAWDEHEELEVRLFSLDEVYAMAERGEIFHSLVIDALFYYYPEWLRHKSRRRASLSP